MIAIPTPVRRVLCIIFVGLAAGDCGGTIGAVAPAPVCTVSSVVVTPATVSPQVGATSQLSAGVASSSCSTAPTTTWSSSAANIATVSATGLVTAVAVGTAVVTATAGGLSGSAAITVVGAPTLTITSLTPAASATAVSIDSIIRIVFSSPIDATTVTTTTFTVSLGANAIAGARTISGSTVTFKPTVPFTEFRSVYTVVVTTGVKSTVGSFLAAAATSTFTTTFGDPGYFYQITNQLVGPTKSVDTFSSADHNAFFDSPLNAFSGQSWYFVPINGTAVTTLKNVFLGDTYALEGGAAGSASLMTPIAAAGSYFTGQAWTFTAFGAAFPNAWRLQNQLNGTTLSLDAPTLSGTPQPGLQTTGTGAGQAWYFTRLGHR